MVDLKKAKAGDIVKFRSGGQAVISKVHEGVKGATVKFTGTDWSEFYLYSGHKMGLKVPHLMDITEIHAAPEVFDWERAKWGMAFTHENHGLLIYLCKSTNELFRVFQHGLSGKLYDLKITVAELTRDPINDLKGDK